LLVVVRFGGDGGTIATCAEHLEDFEQFVVVYDI